MATLKMYRESALPGTLEANSIYYIAPASAPDHVEIYVTGNSGSVVKRVLNEADIQALIDASVGEIGNSLEIVDDIAARDALSLTENTLVLVLDASSDSTVTSSSATYAYRVSDDSWTKISESESMDLVLSWDNLEDKPSSSVVDIDDAVTKRHTHSNKTQLDKIDEDGDGYLTYNGDLPVTGWSSNNW